MINFENLKKYRIRRSSKESVEPEEIFLDASKPEFEGRKIEVPLRPGVFKIFFWALVSGLAVLFGQVFYLQIVRGEEYKNLAERNRLKIVPIPASRGVIYDSSLKQLVYNVPSFDLSVTFKDLPKSPVERRSVIEKAAKILAVPSEEIMEQIKNFNSKNAESFLIANNLEHEKLLAFEAEIDKMPGLRIEKSAARQYNSTPYFSHILGYLGKLGSEDLKNKPDYSATEKIGKSGVEHSFENILRGKTGRQIVEVDSSGQARGNKKTVDSEPGRGIVLAVDGGLQRKLYDEIEKTLKNLKLEKAAAVALDPRSGSVLAMVSFPGFDNNIFSKALSSSEYSVLADDPSRPLFNRAIGGQYAPGSTIKPMIGLAALQEKIISPNTIIADPFGELRVVNQYDPNIIYRFTDWKAHGAVNIYSAIAESCDVYFYTVGGGYGNIEGLGIERIKKYLNLFGFGSSSGIELSGEKNGLLPDPEWKRKAKNEDWFTGDTYHISIGQGDLLVTPLQLAAATAAVANGGKLLTPQLVDKIVDSDKNIIKTFDARVVGENFIDQAHLETIRKAMRQTVVSGTASMLNDLNVEVAGKTGTAQVAGQRDSNAWFTAFAPYKDPEIVIVILIENGGEGSRVSAPIAKEVLRWYFDK